MTRKRVLSVGQCAADHASLSLSLGRIVEVDFVGVDTATEAQERLDNERFDLVLANRVFDANGDSGIEFIRRLASGPAAPPVMLVSNYDDAQKEAVAVGALPGFGKASLGQPAMVQRVREALEG